MAWSCGIFLDIRIRHVFLLEWVKEIILLLCDFRQNSLIVFIKVALGWKIKVAMLFETILNEEVKHIHKF